MPRAKDSEEKSEKDIQRLKNIVGKVSEESKIRLDQMIQEFNTHLELNEITFPNQLTNMERAYVHFQAAKHGLKSASSGYGDGRRVTLRRTRESNLLETKLVSLTQESLQGMFRLSHAFEMEGSLRAGGQNWNTGNPPFSGSRIKQQSTTSRLCAGPLPKVPRPRRGNKCLDHQMRLPIWHHKDYILSQIEQNRVVFIRGSTGCGKTTQVPQFLLDDAMVHSKKIRIICTVPRRIAAISVSDRVAVERGERLGQTVGYQIRLESCTSPTETLLTYCTSGVLLRSLAAPDYVVLKNTTHIIIDEIHERDRQTDFLLTCLRDILSLFPNLRLILMGADLNNELFTNYFGVEFACPIIEIEGRLHPVKVYHLEEVLEMLKYENYGMRTTNSHEASTSKYSRLIEKLQHPSEEADLIKFEDPEQLEAPLELDPLLISEVDNIIRRVWTDGDEECLQEYIDLVGDYVIPVNYQHSTTGITMLMAATVQGLLSFVKTLLALGSDISIKSKGKDCDFTAVEWASDHNQHGVLKYLMEHQYETKLMPAIAERSEDNEKFKRLASYLQSIDEERVDLLLILRLLHQIHMNSDPNNAILVFLPGYDEIVTLKHLILTDNQLGFRHGSFRIFMLHSNVQTGDQRAAFEKPPKGIRKIVLSTNIAESSLTIEDIVYVIDSGKAKEKSFDSMTSVTQLKSVWISKASVNQRRGRAGRCRTGICYHLFSSARYESMAQFPIPEIVRSSLQELCLHARSFMRGDVKIERFFSRIPEPPAPIAVKKSVDLLKVMGALDEDEQLTKLGFHLLDFPLEPFLGKALIYAVVFRCLDPILTLVSVISYKDPFQLPSDPRDKQKAQERKAEFARDSFSDHMAYLKAFQDWEKSKLFSKDVERKFCRDNYISSVTFEMIYAIRSQLMAQLRANGFVMTKGKGDLKELNENSGNWPLVKGVLVATLYPNICGVNREKKVLYNSFNSKVVFHGSTTVVKKKTDIPSVSADWIVFDEMTQQGPSNLVKGCTCVSTAAIALFAGSFTDKGMITDDEFDPGELSPSPSSKLAINQWITLYGDKQTIEQLKFLRQQVTKLIMKKLEAPVTNFTPVEEATIQTIAAVLVQEDASNGFKFMQGVGQWPKLVSGNFMSAPRKGANNH